VLPQLRELELRFGDAIAIVGVHSGKYIAERVTARIADAARRLGVEHAVVNDRQFRIWRAHAIRAWPSLVAIDRDGRVVGAHAGEFLADEVAPFIDGLLGRGGGATASRSGHASGAGPPPHALRYPGKVALDGTRLAIADSGHARVLVGELDDAGRTLRLTSTVGGGEDSPFAGPQGLCFDGDTLHVADALRHELRAIDLPSGTVRTRAGIGKRPRTRADLAAGGIASPWDLALVGRTLFIAAAGSHQLLSLPLDAPRAMPRVHAGSGAEELHDGPLASAALAQPMGLAAAGDRLWFADAESSAVRAAGVAPDGAVSTVVGTGLFDFGDTDGIGDAVRLQHPQGLAVAPDGRLLVADSYNDALKWIDPATRESRVFVRGLHEPGGVALGPGGRAYVADTNAHRIVVVEPGGEMRELRIEV
jgi:sugar lactone lactonase YvrE